MFNAKSPSYNEEEGPKKKALYTIALPQEQLRRLGIYLQGQHTYEPYYVDHALFAFKGNQVNVVGYKSGKVVVQGKKTEDFVQFVIEAEITGCARLGYDEINHPTWFEAHAGLDESGKGDFFGPLVTASVIAEEGIARQFMDMGVKDSKSISSDEAILKLEAQIRKTPGVVVKTTCLSMLKYNELYHKFSSNLNRLLAWMHATTLKSALQEKSVAWGMLDQFSKAPLVQYYFKDTDFDLRMQTKAESDPIVAAASIVARSVYIREMAKLSEKMGEKLQRGASNLVLEQGRRLIEKMGAEALPQFAKCHFRTAYIIQGLPVPEKEPYHKDE